jgi:diguanylate cyclase (GGDEF)-like protein/PAS domain S-box-containing protein
MTTNQPIERIIQKRILSCAPDMPVAEAARYMQNARCSSILVMEKGKPVGIWTERDALSVDFSDTASFDLPIGKVMSKPVITITPEVTISECGVRFREEGVRHFVVVDEDGQTLGIVSQTDVILRHGVEHYLVLRNVKTAMKSTMVVVPPETPLENAVRIMRNAHTDAIIVSGESLAEYGIVTERDLVRFIAEKRGSRPISELATIPLVAIAYDASLLAARNLLEDKHIRHLGVIDETNRLIGLIAFSDILATLQYEYVHRLNDALKERDAALFRSQKDLYLAQRVIASTIDGIMITDAKGIIETVNPAFSRITGYEAYEVIGQTPRILKSGRQTAEFYKDFWLALTEAGFWQGEIWNRRKDGAIYPQQISINAVHDEEGRITQYAAIFNDISERKRTEEFIKSLAYFDSLTNLPNRRLFSDRLALTIANSHRHNHRLSVMFLDLDMFKRINDTLGHSAGDKMLVETAERIKSCLREGDTVARLGGDEFIILLPEIHEIEGSAKLAQRILEKIKQPYNIENSELYITTSIGISVYPEDGETAEILIKNADTAMYRAKDLGRNSYQLYTPSMNARSFERLAMESSLRHAVERDEFLLAYQIKCDMVTGRIAGLEALVRWQHPELGLVQPNDFIPLAENMGVIGELGECVLRIACRQNKIWQEMGLAPVRIAVNVSAHQLRDDRLLKIVPEILAETGLDPLYLELELTESVMLRQFDETAKILHKLREMGITIAMDDFGTGFSSLSYLKRMPIDSLKIDRSFVRDVPKDRDDCEIVSAIIGMAHNLNLKAVAEGVEDVEQVEFLRSKGCNEIQGYLINRPLPAHEIVRFFDRNLLRSPGGE